MNIDMLKQEEKSTVTSQANTEERVLKFTLSCPHFHMTEETSNENVIENSKIQTENEVVNNENKTEEETNIEKDKTAILVKDMINTMIDTLINQDGLLDGTNKIAIAMTEAKMQKEVLTKVGELTGKLMESLASSFNIDTNKFANAFKFEISEYWW